MVQATIESKRNRSIFSGVVDTYPLFVVCESREEGHNIKFTAYNGLSERNTKYEITVMFGDPSRRKCSDEAHISLKRTVNNTGVVSAINNPGGFTVYGVEAEALYADFGHLADSQTIALFGKVMDLAKLHFARRYAHNVLEYGGAGAMGAIEAMVITTELVLLGQGVHDAKFIEPEGQEALLSLFRDRLRLDTEK